MLAVRMLEKQGYAVSVVGNGQAALDALAQQAFDLVLMDVQMPVMDGLKATAAIRVQEQISGTHLPIIAMIAYAPCRGIASIVWRPGWTAMWPSQ